MQPEDRRIIDTGFTTKPPLLDLLSDEPRYLLIKVLSPGQLISIRERKLSPKRTSWEDLVDEYVRRILWAIPSEDKKLTRYVQSLAREAPKVLQLWEWLDEQCGLVLPPLRQSQLSLPADPLSGEARLVTSWSEHFRRELEIYVLFLLSRGRLVDLANGAPLVPPDFAPWMESLSVEYAITLWMKGKARWLPPHEARWPLDAAFPDAALPDEKFPFAPYAHFVMAGASDPDEAGTLQVGFGIANLLLRAKSTTVTASAQAKATYACVGDGESAGASNKKDIINPVSAEDKFTLGQIRNSHLTLHPPRLPSTTLDCRPGERLVLASVTYTNVQVSEPNAGIVSIPETFSRTFFQV